jgi:hypothetical protein
MSFTLLHAGRRNPAIALRLNLAVRAELSLAGLCQHHTAGVAVVELVSHSSSWHQLATVPVSTMRSAVGSDKALHAKVHMVRHAMLATDLGFRRLRSKLSAVTLC